WIVAHLDYIAYVVLQLVWLLPSRWQLPGASSMIFSQTERKQWPWQYLFLCLSSVRSSGKFLCPPPDHKHSGGGWSGNWRHYYGKHGHQIYFDRYGHFMWRSEPVWHTMLKGNVLTGYSLEIGKEGLTSREGCGGPDAYPHERVYMAHTMAKSQSSDDFAHSEHYLLHFESVPCLVNI